MNVQDFIMRKRRGERISMVTCYDAWSARLIADTAIDCVLVGDILAMVVYGHDTTLPADSAMMAAHTAAVRRGAPEKFIIGDMPFLSYRRGRDKAVENAGKLMRAGAQAVKLEGADGNIDTVRYLVESGIPVMGHLGLTPQVGYFACRIFGKRQFAFGRFDKLLPLFGLFIELGNRTERSQILRIDL